MPFSYREGKGYIKKWLGKRSKSIINVLDLGVGSGTYYNFFTKKYPLLTHSTWTGVEVWTPYIEKYELKSKYSCLINEDIRTVDYTSLGKFDLTFAGDILEHITKQEAINLVNTILKISSTLIISIPIIHFPQDEYEGNPYEAHIKDDWTHEEMIETFPQIKQFAKGNKIGVYILTQ
jgi:predicted TPR repeat methyltransferase